MNSVTTIQNKQEYLPATLDKGERLLALATTHEEVKSVMALAAAAVAFAQVEYKGHHDIIQRAEALKLQAERKLGELLAVMPKATGGDAQRTRYQIGTESTKTLADLGIDKKTSARVQALAALPQETFDQVAAGELSVSKAIAPAKPKPKPLYTNPEPTPELSSDDPDMAQLAGELQAENEAYQRKIASIESDDQAAELVRLNTYIDQLTGRFHGLTREKNEAIKIAQKHSDLLAKIRKALSVEKNSDILARLKK